MESTKNSIFDDGFDDDLLAASEHTSPKVTSMTEAQKSRAERNRMKAVALKKARLIANPYPNPKAKEDFLTGEKVTKVSTHLSSLLNLLVKDLNVFL